MAGQDGPSARGLALIDSIRQTPGRFDFFQALRLVECAWRGRPRLGESHRPSEDPVRLGQDPTLAFVPTVLAGVEWKERQAAPRLLSQFLGLFGTHGPLPLHLTEYARGRQRTVGDETFVRFADMFHHRMLSLYYRAFANSRPTTSFDRPETDRFVTYLGALCGIGMPSFLGRDLPDRVRLYYAGRFAAQPKNAEGLQAMISDLFGVPVVIEEFVEEWVDLPSSVCWRLGRGALGGGDVLGARAFSCQGKFRVVVGPVEQEQFDSLLPGTESFAQLQAMVKSYAGDHLGWDLCLILDESSHRPWTLGARSQLGWTTPLGQFRGKPMTIVVKPRQEHGHGRDQQSRAVRQAQ